MPDGGLGTAALVATILGGAAVTASAVKTMTTKRPEAPKAPDLIIGKAPEVQQAVADERRRRQSARGYQATILSDLVSGLAASPGSQSPGTKTTLGS